MTAQNPQCQRAFTTGERHDYGALVGWTHADLGNRINLCIEAATRIDDSGGPEIARHNIMMTHNQALLLANYLSRLSGKTPPVRSRRRWWHRLLGR